MKITPQFYTGLHIFTVYTVISPTPPPFIELFTCRLSLQTDQVRQNIDPDLDPTCLTLMVFLIDLILMKKKCR